MSYIGSKLTIIAGKVKNIGLELRKEQAILKALAGKEPLVSYIGWTGHNNLGDEILYEAHQALFPGVRFVPFRSHPLAALYCRLRGRQLYRAAFLGGGTLINQSPTWLRKIKRCQRQGLPLYCFGTGVTEDRFRHPTEKTDLKQWVPVLETFEFVGVRGPRSERLLKKAGCEKVSVVGDAALALAPPKRTYHKPNRVIGLNYGLVKENTIWGDARTYTKNIAAVIKRLIGDGYEVRLLPVWDQDIKSNQELLRLVDSPRCTLRAAFENLESYAGELDQCGIFIGQKLHATIIACSRRIPSIMIEYQPKCRDFMASIDMEVYTLKTSQCIPDTMVGLIQKLYEGHQDIVSKLDKRVLGYQGLQNKHASKIEAGLLSPGDITNGRKS